MYVLSNKLKQFRLRLGDVIDLWTSRYLDVRDIRSVCLALGPYRNLTTLTASVLFLHPNCQVLNHAGGRIYGNKELDFLLDYNPKKLDRFAQYAIRISAKGQRGNFGGSITHSHAFGPESNLKETYEKSNLPLIKKQIECLFWKESFITSNLIRKRQLDLGSIFEKDRRLRFLLPIRNPLDCATSNLKEGYAHIFQGLNKESSVFEILRAILDEIFWVANLKAEFPNRIFYFFEHEISRNMLTSLAKFLQLDPTEAWLSDALITMKIKSGYDHSDELIDFYENYIKDKGSKWPELSEKLLFFTQKSLESPGDK